MEFIRQCSRQMINSLYHFLNTVGPPWKAACVWVSRAVQRTSSVGLIEYEFGNRYRIRDSYIVKFNVQWCSVKLGKVQISLPKGSSGTQAGGVKTIVQEYRQRAQLTKAVDVYVHSWFLAEILFQHGRLHRRYHSKRESEEGKQGCKSGRDSSLGPRLSKDSTETVPYLARPRVVIGLSIQRGWAKWREMGSTRPTIPGAWFASVQPYLLSKLETEHRIFYRSEYVQLHDYINMLSYNRSRFMAVLATEYTVRCSGHNPTYPPINNAAVRPVGKRRLCPAAFWPHFKSIRS